MKISIVFILICHFDFDKNWLLKINEFCIQLSRLVSHFFRQNCRGFQLFMFIWYQLKPYFHITIKLTQWECYVKNVFEITLFALHCNHNNSAMYIKGTNVCQYAYFVSVYVHMKHFIFYNVAIMEYILKTNQDKSSQFWQNIIIRGFVVLVVL